jgi:hypothetical protein
VADGELAHGRRGWGFIGGAARRGGFTWPSSSTEATVWAKGGGVVGGGGALTNGGLGVRTGPIAPANGQARIIPLRHIVPTAPSLGPTVIEGSQRACACVRRWSPTRRGATRPCAWARSGSRAIPSVPV